MEFLRNSHRMDYIQMEHRDVSIRLYFGLLIEKEHFSIIDFGWLVEPCKNLDNNTLSYDFDF